MKEKGFMLELEPDLFEELFHELEKVQDGSEAHRVEFLGLDKNDAAQKLCMKLLPFFEKRLED